VGRRYRRQDAIGTPFCITIDHQTIEDNTVTVRYRDSMKQERIAVKNLKTLIEDHVSMKNWLKNC
jgi:glycyl-tRNA synthetase